MSDNLASTMPFSKMMEVKVTEATSASVIGETKPIKTGARLSVWQTEIRLENGRQVALVTQTQLVL